VRLRDLVALRRRYAEDYRSSLFSMKEAGASLRSAMRRRSRGGRATRSTEGVPLYFPARVTFELRDGRRETEEIDLPVGALASGDVDRELDAKLVREATPVLGAENVRRLLDARLEDLAPGELALLSSAPCRPCTPRSNRSPRSSPPTS
jgi:hypothetical protein